MSTTSYALVADAVEEACEDLGITVAYGDPGAGKTFALRVAILNRCTLPVTWIEPQHRPTMLALTEQLLRALGDATTTGQRRVLLPPLIERLARPRLIVKGQRRASCGSRFRTCMQRTPPASASAKLVSGRSLR